MSQSLDVSFTTDRPAEAIFSTFAETVAHVQGHQWAMVTPTTAVITRRVVAPWALTLAAVALLVLVAYQLAPSKSPVIWLLVLPLGLPAVFARETRTVTVTTEPQAGSTRVHIAGAAAPKLDEALGSAITSLT